MSFIAALPILLLAASSTSARPAANLTARALTQEPQVDNLDITFTGLPTPESQVLIIEGVPPQCEAFIGADKECKSYMEAADITFMDCTQTRNTLCVCNDNENVTWDDAVDLFAKIPAGLRKHIGTVMVNPQDGSGKQAYTVLGSGEVHLFDVKDQSAWIHEAAHAADGALKITANGDSSDFGKAVAKDTCVPDKLAQSGLQDDYAEQTLVEIYSLLNNGSLPDGLDSDCMKNQLDFINGLKLFSPDTIFGGDSC